MLEIKKTENLEDVYDLYIASFPKKERIDFEDLHTTNTECELLSIYWNQVFVGFFSIFTYESLTSILYFAIQKEFHDKGIGSKALQWLQQYKNKNQIIADLELPKKESGNYLQRMDRVRFYKKNGFCETSIQYTWKNESYCIFSWNGEVSKQEFGEFWKHFGQMRNKKK